MSIQTDDTSTGLSDDAAIAALTGAMAPKQPAPTASEEEEEIEDLEDEEEDLEDLEDDDDNDEADEDDDEDEDDDDEAPASSAAVADDAVVSVVVNGEEQQFTVGSLKRLAGQEAALTRKSQEADLVGQRAAATLQTAIEVVLEDLSAYEDMDWVLEGSRMDPEEFQWHREQYTTLARRRDTLIQGAQNLGQTLEARKQAQLQAEAVEAVRVLSDPQQGIPGWSDELYDGILSYAIDQGLPEDDVATIVNPSVIKIINKARLYDEGQKATAKKVSLTPRRVRTGGGREAISAQSDKTQRALQRKLASGQATDDDAVAALLGRWNVKSR